MKDRPLRVYIAGPMTNGDGKSFNMAKIHEAIGDYVTLIKLGYVPLCPQLSVFCELLYPGQVSYSDWMTLDRSYIDTCDVVLRLPGNSVGADKECCYAEDNDKTVFYGMTQLLSVMSSRIKESTCQPSTG